MTVQRWDYFCSGGMQPDDTGERHGMALLTGDDARAIRCLRIVGGHTQQALADAFGVSRENVKRILNWETWT